jgi:hypothetical protein
MLSSTSYLTEHTPINTFNFAHCIQILCSFIALRFAELSVVSNIQVLQNAL